MGEEGPGVVRRSFKLDFSKPTQLGGGKQLESDNDLAAGGPDPGLPTGLRVCCELLA